MKVSEVMTLSPICCTRETSLQEAARLMVDHDCGCLPVIDDLQTKRPIGTITDRDIVARIVAKGHNPIDLTVGDSMTEGCVTISANTDVHGCCAVMEENQIRRVVVLDDQGRCGGIVSQSDIARKADEKETAAVLQAVSQPTMTASSVSVQ
jgi:CBS domain-containing protein